MAKTAAEIESDIRRKWQSRKLRARGFWLTVRDHIEQHDGGRPGHLLHEDGRLMGSEEIAQLANATVNTVESLVAQLSAVGLLSVGSDNTVYSPILARLSHARDRNAVKQRRHRTRGGLYNPVGGVTIPLCNPDVTGKPPPMVSPPITPSSFPPVLHTSASEVGEDSPVTAAHRQAAYDAFDRWAKKCADRPLDATRNEHTAVANLLATVAQDAPIVRSGEQVARHLLVPEVVASCIRNGKDFKGVSYACQTVKNTLDDWSRKGIPGTAEPEKNRRPVNRPLTTAQVFDPEAAR